MKSTNNPLHKLAAVKLNREQRRAMGVKGGGDILACYNASNQNSRVVNFGEYQNSSRHKRK